MDGERVGEKCEWRHGDQAGSCCSHSGERPWGSRGLGGTNGIQARLKSTGSDDTSIRGVPVVSRASGSSSWIFTLPTSHCLHYPPTPTFLLHVGEMYSEVCSRRWAIGLRTHTCCNSNDLNSFLWQSLNNLIQEFIVQEMRIFRTFLSKNAP